MSQNLHNPLSLSDVTKLVDQWFREMFGEWKFRFVAELSQIKSTKGRYYLDLVQFDDQQAIIAKCRWIVFQASIIDSLIVGGTISQIGELKWAKLLMSGVCNFHYEYGFSIIIQDISQEYLVWQFEKYKQDTIKILQELGIIDHNRKIQLGFPPYHIAIISSPTSEGLKDFMTILDESGYRVSTTLYPTMIHGNDAKLEVYQTLKTLYQSIQSWQKLIWWPSSVVDEDLMASCDKMISISPKVFAISKYPWWLRSDTHLISFCFISFVVSLPRPLVMEHIWL